MSSVVSVDITICCVRFSKWNPPLICTWIISISFIEIPFVKLSHKVVYCLFIKYLSRWCKTRVKTCSSLTPASYSMKTDPQLLASKVDCSHYWPSSSDLSAIPSHIWWQQISIHLMCGPSLTPTYSILPFIGPNTSSTESACSCILFYSASPSKPSSISFLTQELPANQELWIERLGRLSTL